jgi:hypothetical protein
MTTAAEIEAYFVDNGVNTSWQYDTNWQHPDPAGRMEDIASRLNSGDLTWASLNTSLGHLRFKYLGGEESRTLPVSREVSPSGIIPGTTFLDPKQDRAQQRREMELIYGWLPPGAIDLWINEWIESGNEDAAWAVIRTNPQYEKWFPGNLTEDGRVRYSEEQYAATVESYRDIYRSMGLNSSLLDGRIGDLIRGEVSPNEFSARVTGMWDRVISASDSIRQYYADTNGVQGLTTEALLAGALDPNVGDKILDGRMSVAEVGGEALGSGFRLSAARVEELIGEGMTRNTANSLFGEAERLVPTLSVLARRHSDPNDEFDIEDFLSAEFFKNPAENLRTQRLVAQERAQFTSGLAARRNQAGAMTGLIAE